VDGVRIFVGSLNPGQEADDIVLFQPPGKTATRLKLELPVSPTNTGTFLFVIPVSMLKRGAP
jgi:hypothetical protein